MNRVRLLYGLLLMLALVFSSRLFYLQIVKGEDFTDLALSEQMKKYEIPAERGRIYLRELSADSQRVPIVLNENRPTLYADPRYVTDPRATAEAIAAIIGGDINQLDSLLKEADRYYVVLAKKLTEAQANAITKLELDGIGLQDTSQRAYPEGALAAQTLGFVNDAGDGLYGIEGALDDELKGESGLLKAITDVRGIPLTTSEDAVLKDPVDGDDVVLTIDRGVQSFVEQALAKGVKASSAKGGSAVVMDPYSGAVLAMANYPTYEPAKFSEVNDEAVFINSVISSPYEIGSVAKPFTMSAGLNEGKVKPTDTYFDPGYAVVDGIRIDNATGVPGGTHTMSDVIQQSVNSGVVHVLKQLSGGVEVNQGGREKLYDYLTDAFGFGQLTGIELAAEAEGTVFKPTDADGNNVRYANMTFGQGMSQTMLQAVSAFASLVNGGTYYQPYMVHSRVTRLTGQEVVTEPKALRQNVITQTTSKQIREMMERVVESGGGRSAFRTGYSVGGKTGTSQKLQPDGTYSESLEVGSFLGFGAGASPQYVIMIKVDEPDIAGYAGTVAAAPIFAEISHFMIDYYRIPPVR